MGGGGKEEREAVGGREGKRDSERGREREREGGEQNVRKKHHIKTVGAKRVTFKLI